MAAITFTKTVEGFLAGRDYGAYPRLYPDGPLPAADWTVVSGTWRIQGGLLNLIGSSKPFGDPTASQAIFAAVAPSNGPIAARITIPYTLSGNGGILFRWNPATVSGYLFDGGAIYKVVAGVKTLLLGGIPGVSGGINYALAWGIFYQDGLIVISNEYNTDPALRKHSVVDHTFDGQPGSFGVIGWGASMNFYQISVFRDHVLKFHGLRPGLIGQDFLIQTPPLHTDYRDGDYVAGTSSVEKWQAWSNINTHGGHGVRVISQDAQVVDDSGVNTEWHGFEYGRIQEVPATFSPDTIYPDTEIWPGSEYTLAIPAGAANAPEQPVLTVDNESTATASFTGSKFYSPVADSHSSSQWQVDTLAGNFLGALIYDSGDSVNFKTHRSIGGLDQATTYLARIRYKDSTGRWSNYSAPLQFKLIDAGGQTGLIIDKYMTLGPVLFMPLQDTSVGPGDQIQDISGNDHHGTVYHIVGGVGAGGILSAGNGVVVGGTAPYPPDLIWGVFYPLRKYLGKSLGSPGGSGDYVRIPYAAWMDIDDFVIAFGSQRLNTTGLHPIVSTEGDPSPGFFSVRWQGTTLQLDLVDNTSTTRTLSQAAPLTDRPYFITLRKNGTAVDIFVGDPVTQIQTKYSFAIPLAPLNWHVGTHRDILLFTQSVSSWHMFGVASMLAIFPVLTDTQIQDLWNGFNDVGVNKPAIFVNSLSMTTVDLMSSGFSSSDPAKVHASSDWQIDEPTGDFTSPILRLDADVSRLVYWTGAGPLVADTLYQARMRQTDSVGTHSQWSDPAIFKTLSTAFTMTPPDDGGESGPVGPPAGGGWNSPAEVLHPEWPACPAPGGSWVT